MLYVMSEPLIQIFTPGRVRLISSQTCVSYKCFKSVWCICLHVKNLGLLIFQDKVSTLFHGERVSIS